MAVYFLRHGESEANIANVFAGQREDSPLSALGNVQAKNAGIELMRFNITKIIASPLQRTKLTAKIVARELGIENIIEDSRIKEYDMGALTGLPRREITSEQFVAAEGAEDPIQFKARVLQALVEFKDSEGNILLVSHAGVGRIIESARLGIEASKFYDLKPYPNAHAVALELSWLKSSSS